MSATEPTVDDYLQPFRSHIDQAKLTQITATLKKQDGGYTLATDLPTLFTPAEIVPSEPWTPQNLWDTIGQLFLSNRRFYDALAVFESLYRHMLRYQIDETKYTHKGMPLVWMSECFLRLG